MKLHDQLMTLENIGLPLKEGTSIEDLLASFYEAQFEADPYGLILYMLGSEAETGKSGRRYCEFAMNLWMKRVYRSGDYTKLIKELKDFAGSNRVTVITDKISKGTVNLSYSVDGEVREISHKLDGNTFDPYVFVQMLSDIQGDGRAFCIKCDGFSMTLFYLPHAACKQLIELDPDQISAILD